MKKLVFFFTLSASMLQAQEIISYYPLDGNADDLSGYSKNGVSTNTVSTFDRNNNANSAIQFNGTDSKIEVSDTSGFNSGNGSLTVAAWFKNESLSGINPILSTGMQGFATGMYLSCNYLYSPGKVVFALAGSVNGFPAGVASSIFIQSELSTYNDGEWHHVAVVVDKTNNIVSMYIDGVKSKIQKYNAFGATGGVLQNNDEELNISGIVNNGKPSQAYTGIGCASGAGQYWNGDLDEVY